jgi:hypothetical protein
MFLRIYNPEVFQGNLKKKHYFEGWYFKHVTREPNYAFSFIPGVSLAENDSHAFIQIMNGYAGKADYIRYPLADFTCDKKKLYLKVGSSIFSNEGVILDIESENLKISGQIDYSNSIKYPKSVLSPGIMGWYTFVPFMECYHDIVSVNHDLNGKLSTDGIVIDFAEGKGYIEKDWGISFPEGWVWIQSNNFGEHDTSFSFSIAKIPWLGSFFIGFIAFLFTGKKFYLFSTYNKSKVSEIAVKNDSIEITVRNKHHILSISVIKNSFGELRAPVSGEMSRRIKESVDSVVHLELLDKDYYRIYEGTGKNVGLEIMDPGVLTP